MDYNWPRENLCEYKFDAGWPNDVKPEEIVVPFTSWIQENEYRIAQRNRHVMIVAAEKRDRKHAFVWSFQRGLYKSPIR
jgi:hypothetical protein